MPTEWFKMASDMLLKLPAKKNASTTTNSHCFIMCQYFYFSTSAISVATDMVSVSLDVAMATNLPG